MLSTSKPRPFFVEEHHIDLARVGKVLVVGGRSTNFPSRFRENPRFIFWDSTQPNTLRRAKIPAHVTHVITARFIPHKLTFHLRKIMPLGVRLVNSIEGTGRINEFLDVVAQTAV